MCRRSVEVRRRMRRSQLLAALERPSAEGLCPFTPLYARSLRGTRRTALVVVQGLPFVRSVPNPSSGSVLSGGSAL